ncbi:hypothetical protein PG994_002532 [Apiospora phragmitis]|uniref:Cytochrome P450 n=1 Tax=Apiospora phragmitis TaxID=2905665 RepID=A0ABR1W882_9PEZI
MNTSDVDEWRHRFAQDSVDERFGPNAEARRDMIAMFLKHGASKEEATGEALVQVVAGTDSVAVAIRMTLLYVLTTPRVYNLLLAELDAAARTGALTTTPMIRDAEAKRLPYLQAVIREGLRVFLALTSLLAKSVPAEGDTVAGHFLPGGTEVGIDGWGILRSREYWGADAHAFRPERWLEAGKEQLEDMAECLEILFGYGKYKCLGRGIAIMEINKVLPELLRRYDFTILDPTAPIKKMHSAAFWLMTDFWVTVTPRRSD